MPLHLSEVQMKLLKPADAEFADAAAGKKEIKPVDGGIKESVAPEGQRRICSQPSIAMIPDGASWDPTPGTQMS